MQPGQACIEHQPFFTNWDFRYQKDHRNTVKDKHGLACANPSSERFCPKARRCTSADLCHVDWPDWTNDKVLDERWESDVPDYLDPGTYKEQHWPYVTPEYERQFLDNIDWGIRPESTRRVLADEEP